MNGLRREKVSEFLQGMNSISTMILIGILGFGMYGMFEFVIWVIKKVWAMKNE